jgi:hypothetical protein
VKDVLQEVTHAHARDYWLRDIRPVSLRKLQVSIYLKGKSSNRLIKIRL